MSLSSAYVGVFSQLRPIREGEQYSVVWVASAGGDGKVGPADDGLMGMLGLEGATVEGGELALCQPGHHALAKEGILCDVYESVGLTRSIVALPIEGSVDRTTTGWL
jgi:hypothetical protein